MPTTTIPFHPLANLFPLMEGEEFDALVADIKENGLFERIILFEGMILDGRNRYRALLAAGLDPADANKFTIDGAAFVDDPAVFVVSANIHRRHLTAEQKRDVIAKLLKAAPEKSNRQIAKTAGVSHPHVAKVRAEMEEAGDVETVSTSIDTKGRKQPAKKARATAGTAPRAAGGRAPEGRRDEFDPLAEKAAAEAGEKLGEKLPVAEKARQKARRRIMLGKLRRWAARLVELDPEVAGELYDLLWAAARSMT
jgi:DNA-binding Lrp family transcriptional regulator